MGKKSVKIPLIYAIGMALIVIGFCCPMFKAQFLGTANGFKFIDFDKSNFVTIGALLVFAGGVAGLVFSVVNVGSSTKLLRLVALVASIAGGIVLFVGFQDNKIYQAIGKQFLKHAYCGFYMLVAGWVAGLAGYLTGK